MSWAAVIAGGAAIVGGVVSQQGAKKAANIASQGSDAAVNEAARQFDTIRGDSIGRINIGNQALNSLGAMYGHSPNVGMSGPNALSRASPYEAPPIQDGGYFNTGGGAVLNPWTVTSKLGDAGKILDPLGGIFGNLFGNKHGDEKRNLKAFTDANQLYDLGNGMIGMADGTSFPKEKLQEIAGHWYGATYAPDGNQEGWKQSYDALISPYRAPAANVGQGGGQTSDGVQQGFPSPMGAAGAPNSLAAPDYSAFFKSPDYQFRRTEGMRDVGNSFSASGGVKSGNALKALADFNSNLAAGEFGNYFNRQAALAGIGQTATNTSAAAGLQTGANIGNALMNGADARASGVAGQYNAIGAGLSGAASAYGDYLQSKRQPNGLQALNWGYGRTPTGAYA